MSSFEPANLSPLPKEPTACALPYGLTWDELVPVLPDFDERELSRAQAFASHEKQGIHGGENSCILRLSYTTGKNQLRSETVFIKHAADPSKAEAQKYGYLASQGVPTPRLLAAFQKGQAEILLLEFLPAIGIDFSSTGQVNSLLHLVAKLNTIPNASDFFHSSPGLPQVEFDQFVQAALDELAHDSILPSIDVPRWFEAYQTAQAAYDLMPQAINHNEFYFQQVGWAPRGQGRQLVLFDLETMALAPRFRDIAGILYPLAVYTRRDQAELFQVYLDRLSQLSHDEPFSLSRPGIHDVLREFRILRVTDACYSLPWLVEEAKHPEARGMQESLRMTVSCLREDLTALEFL